MCSKWIESFDMSRALSVVRYDWNISSPQYFSPVRIIPSAFMLNFDFAFLLQSFDREGNDR